MAALAPASAQTIVELGIDVTDIRTTSNLKNALDIAFRQSI